MGVSNGFNMRDANLKNTRALPGSATTVYSSGIQIDNSANGTFVAPCELLISAPACTTGQLGDTQTLVYFVQTDDNSSFSSATNFSGTLITQTGASGAGAAAATARIKLPSTVEKYIRLGVTKTGASDASAVSATLEVLF